MNDLYPVYNPYQFDVPDETSDLSLDNLQMAFVEILKRRKECKGYDTYKLIKLGAEFGRALMLYVDGLDEADKVKYDNKPDPYDAMVDADLIDQVMDRR